MGIFFCELCEAFVSFVVKKAYFFTTRDTKIFHKGHKDYYGNVIFMVLYGVPNSIPLSLLNNTLQHLQFRRRKFSLFRQV